MKGVDSGVIDIWTRYFTAYCATPSAVPLALAGGAGCAISGKYCLDSGRKLVKESAKAGLCCGWQGVPECTKCAAWSGGRHVGTPSHKGREHVEAMTLNCAVEGVDYEILLMSLDIGVIDI
jgi:hypothetical protein